MKHTKLLAALLFLSLIGSFVQAACPVVASNKAHVCWQAVAAYTDGSAVTTGTVITYTIQRQVGATWANDGTTTATDWTSGILAPGTYTYRVTATVLDQTSAPSNSTDKLSANPTPNAPVIIVAVTINAQGVASYRLIYTVKPKDGEVVFLAPESMRKLFASK